MYQVSRAGGGLGATSRPGAVCGATQRRASVPVKSNAAAALAAARRASIWSDVCAGAPAMPNPAAMTRADANSDLIGFSLRAATRLVVLPEQFEPRRLSRFVERLNSARVGAEW